MLTNTVKIKRYRGRQMEECEDLVVREVPFTLFVNDEELVTLVCSPHSLEELATGFLCSEGMLHHPRELKEIKVNSGEGLIWVETTSPVSGGQNFLKRYITTCCGKGRASFYFVNDARDLKPLEISDFRITPADITRLAELHEERAGIFRSTGGVHSAALCQPEKILAFYEDIGRHNAVDKILGYCFINSIPLTDKIIALSGRVSSEILIKVARMGIPVVVSRSASTDLALRMADELGVTVAGFVRGDRINLYTHTERVVDNN